MEIQRKFDKFVQQCDSKNMENLLNNHFEDIDLTVNNYYALKVTVITNEANILKLMLKNNSIDLSTENHILIMLAIQHQNYEVFKLLVEDERTSPEVNFNAFIVYCELLNVPEKFIYLLFKQKSVLSTLPNDNITLYNKYHKIIKQKTIENF